MIKRVLSMMVAIVAFCSMAEAATHTTTFTRTDFTQKGQTCTYEGGVQWTNDGVWKNFATLGAYFGWSGTKALQFGSTSNPCLEFSLTSSSFADKVVTKVTVITSTGNSAEATCSVSVGGTSYGTETITTDPTAYDFTGSASGDVVVSWAQTTERALYVTSITVEYEEVAGALEAPVVEVSANAAINFDPITVTMTAAEGASIYYTLDGTAPTSASTLYESAFQISDNATIKAIAVKNGQESGVSESITLVFGKSVANIAALIELSESEGFSSTTYVRIENDVTAVYHYSKNLYVKDESGWLLLSDTYSRYKDNTINNGDIIPGGFYGRFSTSTIQMNYLDGINVSAITAGDPVAPIALGIDAIGENNIYQLVKISAASLTAPVANMFTITANGESIDGYNQFKIDMSGLDTEKTYDVVGIVSYSYDPIIYLVSFTESDAATGVKYENENENESGFFNLAGQRVSAARTGIIISNGKKYVVK